MYIVQGPDNKDIKILIGQASGFFEADIDKLAKIIRKMGLKSRADSTALK
ncbi:MAG: hypothetical protein V7K77_12785 [Nostoc sp.]